MYRSPLMFGTWTLKSLGWVYNFICIWSNVIPNVDTCILCTVHRVRRSVWIWYLVKSTIGNRYAYTRCPCTFWAQNPFWLKDFQFNIIWKFKQTNTIRICLLLLLLYWLCQYCICNMQCSMCNVHVYFPTVKFKFPFQWIASKQIARIIH